MASPHVCGVANLYLGMGIKAKDVLMTMQANAFKDVIVGLKPNTTNLLVHNNVQKRY